MGEITQNSVITKSTVLSILKNLKSGIAIDAAKNHTGIVIWQDGILSECGFALDEYDKTDYFAEYKMRRDFKQKLKNVVEGKSFQVCIIEDVYGGVNFDTVRKLLAINTVVDELIFEHAFFVEEFYRWNEPKWLSLTRMLYKQRGKLNTKIETQGILEYLEYSFYLENMDKTKEEKKAMYFEDKCDACGMLLAVAVSKITGANIAKATPVKLSDIKMYYIEDVADSYAIRDAKITEDGFIAVELNSRGLESSIISQVMAHPNDAMCAFLPSSKLGVFGMKQKFTFYDSDEGYLIFYKKGGQK